jgi:hypothetical protein
VATGFIAMAVMIPTVVATVLLLRRDGDKGTAQLQSITRSPSSVICPSIAPSVLPAAPPVLAPTTLPIEIPVTPPTTLSEGTARPRAKPAFPLTPKCFEIRDEVINSEAAMAHTGYQLVHVRF